MVTVNRPSRGSDPGGGGRPSSYCDLLADEICERLACGESLRIICSSTGMPHRTTVFRWLAHREAFRSRYELARQLQADTWHDEIKDLATSAAPRDPATGRVDAAAMAHRRNMIGTLKWLAQKHASKKATAPSS